MSSSSKILNQTLQENISHPPDIIKFHIVTGVCIAFLIALFLSLYVFFRSIKNDPVLYTHMSLGTENTNNLERPMGRQDNRNSIVKANLESRLSKTKILLEAGSLKCVIEPRRPYFPQNPLKCPFIFPQKPMVQYVTPAFFLKLSEDTLFFIFYYLPNTLQQLMAASELKKLSWRYHKKYMAWFQRTDEPIKVTETFEQGSFVYFDPEDWRKVYKQDFTFYYSFLD